jgi:hypothetical protein
MVNGRMPGFPECFADGMRIRAVRRKGLLTYVESLHTYEKHRLEAWSSHSKEPLLWRIALDSGPRGAPEG